VTVKLSPSFISDGPAAEDKVNCAKGSATMKSVLLCASIAEAATGLALLAVPSLVAQLLFGMPFGDPLAIIAARVAGTALLALSAACWWGSPYLGMVVYSAGITVLLTAVGLTGALTGVLLWPVIILHAAVTVLLVASHSRSSFRD
jgi:hypothetical protein